MTPDRAGGPVPDPGTRTPPVGDPVLDAPSAGSAPTGSDPTPVVHDVVDDVRAAVLAVPGVHDLHGGAFGEAATYLPGRRVAGIALREDRTDLHVTLAFGAPVRETADAVRRAIAPWAGGRPVHVTVEDVV